MNTFLWVIPFLLAPRSPVRVVTVCEALADPGRYNQATIVVVGIFKSGMDETLRQDCPHQLVSGDIAWPNAIALSNPATPPDEFRSSIQKKRAEIFAGYPAAAQPRPERVVGLYGRLVFSTGLMSIPCCRDLAEQNAAPARLFGLGEKDLRVIR